MSRISSVLACVLLISANIIEVECDNKVTKVRRRSVEGTNEGRAQTLEIEFMKWVNLMGKRNHSTLANTKTKDLTTYVVVVDKDPQMGNFTSLQDAINFIPEVKAMRAIIRVNAGTYREKVSIPQWKGSVSIEGAGAESTIIEWGDTAQTLDSNGKPLGTFGSATFANTAAPPPSGAIGRQGVAFRISADAAAFIGCRFVGAQDTLYDQLGRHYYKECYVEGSVDFIFGNGLSLFEGCHLHAIAEKMGAVTAQRRSSYGDDTGFSFVKCKLTGSGALFLGRAWGPYSRVVFAYTYMDNIILPKGWYDWGDPSRHTTVYYGQYKCTGPGATFAGRVSWSKELTDDQARPFLSLAFIDASHWLSNP